MSNKDNLPKENEKEKEKEKENKIEEKEEEVKQVVTTTKVVAGKEGVDYVKIVEEFGMQLITDPMIEKMGKLSKTPLHHWIKRGLFFSHRNLDQLLDKYEKGEPFYLYTGRGPSSESMHLGHLIPFMMTKWLQDAFGCPCVIQLTDDEKFLWNPKLTLEKVHQFMIENAKDIIACGFDPEKTFIFSDMNYIGEMYPNICKIRKILTFNQVRSTFGFTKSSNIGQIAFSAVQAAPAFSSSFPKLFADKKKVNCLIPCAVDQDPYFRLTRDIAPKLKEKKPSLMCSKFIPSLLGLNEKMSSSNPNSAIFLTDTPNQIRNKINKYAFSGGGDTIEEHRKNGANLKVDIPFHYLKIFHPDQERIEQIRKDYGSGQMLTGEVKKELISILQDIVKKHQENRKAITDEVLQKFMTPRQLV
ncbi:tryptophan--tRNA ligase cytoplasmic [Anaeramoeba ignava]|uniref:Tryptophan--tRNA ligase, cytoplasmic n=1 Tax=Anaeramoeba ignava TaxID=1746090 RepID=A0A9Q0LQZ3_ANAIG|nr:tryptophan--tRNA ligase cytoplasmic [Anaeramoeba ignava]